MKGYKVFIKDLPKACSDCPPRFPLESLKVYDPEMFSTIQRIANWFLSQVERVRFKKTFDEYIKLPSFCERTRGSVSVVKLLPGGGKLYRAYLAVLTGEERYYWCGLYNTPEIVFEARIEVGEEKEIGDVVVYAYTPYREELEFYKYLQRVPLARNTLMEVSASLASYIPPKEEV